MAKYNRGAVFTNNNCIGCNKCISGCPAIGANVSVFRDGRNHIEVDDRKCIHCGHCISVCQHDAREYIDDTDAFFSDLAAGKKISVAVAPSLYTLYPDKAAGLLGYLKKLGVNKIYDVSFGADIATWCHIKFFDENEDNHHAIVSQSCPAIVNYIERCAPDLIPILIPIHSPVVCLGIYLRKYLGVTDRIAFINPCVAKRDEILSSEAGGNINYSVSFRHLKKRLENVDLSPYHTETDLCAVGLGELFPGPGGFKDYAERFLPREDIVLRSEGIQEKLDNIYSFGKVLSHHSTPPRLVDILNCDYGCLSGPGTETHRHNILDATDRYRKIVSSKKDGAFDDSVTYEERKKRLFEMFSSLDPADFKREFVDRYQQPYIIPENAYDEIFNAMYKTTELSRNVNCRSCGYKTCRNMVEAIAYGYNKKENCVHYMNEEITRLYYTDTLTGIPNKVAFLRDAAKILADNPDTTYVVGTADINEFRAVNDLYGFAGGDKVLKLLAQRGKAFVAGMGLCARLDTDHFALFFPYTEENMEKLCRPDFYDCTSCGINFPVTLRYGLYIAKNRSYSVDRMLEFAAIAMTGDSDTSRNSFSYYNAELRNELVLEANITEQMWEALEKNEFVAYVQPQYDRESCKVVGGEVLCRWKKPDGSIISPSIFIPVFEKNGFITELDKCMWRHAAEILKNQRDRGLPTVPLAVNISRMSLIKSDVPEIISGLCGEYGIEPRMLHLEITESAYMQNQSQMLQTVEKLRSLGFVIAMDDFGAGYSSLNILKDVPFDILKLDMGFLRETVNVEKSKHIISSVVNMSQKLNLMTVAEGVETDEQADFLHDIGCNIIQGYLYSRPVPTEEYEKLLCK